MNPMPGLFATLVISIAVLAIPLHHVIRRKKKLKKFVTPQFLNYDGQLVFSDWKETYILGLNFTATWIWALFITVNSLLFFTVPLILLDIRLFAVPSRWVILLIIVPIIGLALWKFDQARKGAKRLGFHVDEFLRDRARFNEKWIKPEALEPPPATDIPPQIPEAQPPQPVPPAPDATPAPMAECVNTVTCPHCGVIFDAKGLPGEHKFQCPDETCRRLLQVTFG